MRSIEKLFRLCLCLGISLFFLWGCSKKAETPTKLKVTLAGLGTMPAGVGDGGALLFGRSNDGKSFGKKIANSEEVLDIPNGQWTFFAVFWDATGSAMSGTVYCARSVATLVGSDVTINLNVSNSFCADPDFSNGKFFTNNLGKIQFPEMFVEDCDELPANGYGCGLANQGNALSYRLAFSEYKKDGAAILFSPNKLYSGCKALTEAELDSAAPINFPVGVMGSPFIVQIEFFLGSDTCNTADPKGMHAVTLNGGVGVAAGLGMVKTSARQCDSISSTHYSTPPELADKERMCIDDLATFSSGSCFPNSMRLAYRRFVPEIKCNTVSDTNISFKHLVAIPQGRICDPYINVSSKIGTHEFAAGNGTRFRPYKICTEWQLNQIGELNAPSTYASSHYKLMNNLDMNKVNFGPYAKPQCEGVAGSVLERYNNLNPLDGVVETNCGTVKGTTGFSGIFWGNSKTIKNMRVRVKNVDKIGFIRELNSPAKIYDLSFKRPEVEARNYVGVVAGKINSSGSNVITIENIKIDSPYLEARAQSGSGGEYAGVITGELGSQSRIYLSHVHNADISGTTIVGGLVGSLSGKMYHSSFNGIVESYNNSMANTYLGGLAGLSPTGSVIKSSYSEGELTTRTHYVGGISGSNVGTIEDSYSSMIINSTYSNSGAVLGGITGLNSGTVNRTLFFGKLNYAGFGAGPIVNGVTDSGATFSYTNYTPAGSGTTITYGQFRDGGATINFDSPGAWQFQTNYLPRLVTEQRPCLQAANRAGVSLQLAGGRGGVLNPVRICDADQLKNIGVGSSGNYYSIEEDIDLSPLVTKSDLITSFSGTLNGNNNSLFSLNLTISDDGFDENIGLFRNNLGTITNLDFSNFRIVNSDQQDLAVGLLVGRNDGTVRSVIGAHSEVEGFSKIGLVVGENSGTIQKVYSDYSKVKGYREVGGLVGHNTASGNINRSASHSEVINVITPSDFAYFGGVIGRNLGSVDQVEFSGKLVMSQSTAFSGLYAGGIAGENSGNIQNTLVKSHGELRVKDTQKIGGLVGVSSAGSVTKSVFLGKAIYDNSFGYATIENYFNPLIGYMSGSSISSLVTSSSFIGSFISSDQILSVTGSGPYAHTLDVGNINTQAGASASTKLDLMLPANNSNNFLIPFTISTDHILDSDFALPMGNVSLFKSYPLSTYHSNEGFGAFEYTILDLSSLGTYCTGGFSGSAGLETCNSGFDIVYEDNDNPANNKGFDRMLNYYLALMNETAPSVTPPIWKLDSDGDKGPELLQVED